MYCPYDRFKYFVVSLGTDDYCSLVYEHLNKNFHFSFFFINIINFTVKVLERTINYFYNIALKDLHGLERQQLENGTQFY